jgi:hypothetical protein
MKRFTSVDTSVLKQHYEKKVHDLEQEKKVLQVSAFVILDILCFQSFKVHVCILNRLCCQCTERDWGIEMQSCQYIIYF